MTTFSHPKLLAAIQKACPELMELTFGCELKSTDKNYRRYYTGASPEEGQVFFSEIDEVGSEDDYFYLDGEVDTKDILGHEPQLADVLRSVTDTEARLPIEIEYSACANLFSIAYYDGMAREGKRHECFWNLSLGLYSQSTEVKDFLESLLV